MRYASLILLFAIGAFAIAEEATQPANLVTNGSFADAKDKVPAGWELADGNEVTVDAEEHPSGIAQSLKVHIRVTAENQAAVTQAVRNVPANTKLTLSGQMKGTDMRLGYLQVKLKKGGKELKREKTDWNTNDWKVHTITFDTGEADEISVECRFSQSQKAMDDKIYFADVTLTRAAP